MFKFSWKLCHGNFWWFCGEYGCEHSASLMKVEQRQDLVSCLEALLANTWKPRRHVGGSVRFILKIIWVSFGEEWTKFAACENFSDFPTECKMAVWHEQLPVQVRGESTCLHKPTFTTSHGPSFSEETHRLTLWRLKPNRVFISCLWTVRAEFGSALDGAQPPSLPPLNVSAAAQRPPAPGGSG